MKTLSPSVSVLSCLATAACLLVPCTSVTAAEPYRKETHGPRIGSRILYFFKDLAYGDNPNDRYRHLPRNQPPMQQPNYNVRPPGERYSLDQPPPMNGQPRQPQPQYPVQQPPVEPRIAAPRDMPYTSPDAPPPQRENYQADNGGPEDIPPVKVKPKTPAQKPAPAPKPEELADSKPAAQPKRTIPLESNPPVTQTVSSNTGTARKSWQALSGDAPAPASAPTPTPPPPTVDIKSSPPPVPANSSTLTGSKTSKDGRVKSPYPPFNELDVTGLPTGSLAMDPTTGKVFRVP